MAYGKTLVAYYSNTGSNKYLAEKIADRLDATLAQIRPRINNVTFLVMCSMIKIGPGIRDIEPNPEEFDRLILVGPIWFGKLAAPLSDTLKKYRDQVSEIDLVTCCGSTFKEKYDKYGYETVFSGVREFGGENLRHCVAFPIQLVLPEELKEDSETMMSTRLSDDNFEGDIIDRLEAFVRSLDPEPVSL